MKKNLLHSIVKAALCAAFIFFSQSSFSQGNSGNGQGSGSGKPSISSLGLGKLPMWGLNANSIDSTAIFGSTNNMPVKVVVNNILRGSFTNSGMELVGNFHSAFASVDSIVSSWKIIAEILQAEAVRSEQYYQNDTLIDLVNLQTTVANIRSSQWQNDTINPSNIFYSFGSVGIGTSNPSVPLEVSGSIKITGSDTTGSGGGGGGGGTAPPAPSRSIIIDGGLDRIIATSGTLDFSNTNLTTTGSFQSSSITTANLTIIDKIESDSMHARKSIEINNSLRLLRDTSVMYAEMSTKDTAVALMLQKDAAAPVVIGDAPAPPPGESRAKLTVAGNTKLDGQLNVTGDITSAGSINANCVTTSCLNVSGQTSFDSLNVTNRIKIGTSSLYVGGLGPGNPIGGLDNNIYSTNSALSLQNGSTFNTLINPTGGNVAIGTSAPLAQLDVRIPIDNNKIGAMVKNSSNDGIFIVPKLGPGGFNYHSVEGDAGIFWDGYQGANQNAGLVIGPWESGGWAGMRITHEGNIGIGTSDPQSKLAVDGSIRATGKISASAFTSNSPLPFEAPAGTERMRIDDISGNVGINTTQPSEKLHVSGNIRIDDAYDLRLRNSYHGLGWYGNSDITTPTKLFANADIDGPVLYGFSGGALGVKTTEYDESLYQDVEVERIALRWDENGNVGIGTAVPDERLHIAGVSPAIHLTDYAAQGSTTDTTSLVIRADNGAARLISNQSVAIFINGDNNEDNRTFEIKDNGNFYGGTVKTLFSINENGNAELYGRFKACEAEVEVLQGCDFVFADNYSLPAWEKRMEQIVKNKHLPYIMPAGIMEKDGMSLGETMLGLLRNMEEHDLYMDEQNRETKKLKIYIAEQNEKISDQQKQIDELKKELEKIKVEKK